MKKILRWSLLVLGAAFIVLQFIRPPKNHSEGFQPNTISKAFPISPEVETILRRSCFDCHSNNTMYPWYAEVQPVGWWLRSHIDDAQRELNFDEFASYRPRRQFGKLQEMAEQIDEELMPLPSYLLMHRDARLSADGKTMLADWVVAMRDSMKVWYPPDSLQRARLRE